MSDRTTGTRNSGPGMIVLLILNLSLGYSTPAAAADLTLDAAVHNPERSERFVARDSARHPLEELAFSATRTKPNTRPSGKRTISC